MKLKKLQKLYKEKYESLPDSHDDQLYYITTTHNVDMNKVESEINRIKSLEWKTVSFSFPLIPYPADRPKSTSNGHFYVEGAHEHWIYMNEYLKSHDIIHTATKFNLTLYLPMPESSMTGTEMYLAQLGYINPIGGGDWDNFGKTYSDAIQQILILNDNIIIEGLVVKKYCIKPRVDLTLQYQEGYDSKYNKRKIESTVSYKKLIQK